MASLLILLLPSVPSFQYLILFILIQIPPYLSSNDNYTSCSTPYDCGVINNIGFPFWGQGRPKWCGHPLLQLSCDRGQTFITIKDVKYKILDPNPDNQTMRIARVDYFEDLCPSKLVNTTLDPELFVYGSEDKNLTLFYNCDTSKGLPINCFPNGTSNQYFYAQFGPLGPPPTICTTSVVIPYLFDIVDWTNIQAAIFYGFFVRWIVGIGECLECQKSGGACGYDWNSNRTTCYCRDQAPYPWFKACPSSPNANAPPHQDDVLPSSASPRADDSKYMDCSKTFSCGGIRNLTYPFWGESRPKGCGEPNLEITCENGVDPKFTVDSVTYRIVAWNLETESLTVAREDYWSSICLNDYKNNTLDQTVFQYDDSNIVNVTLLYNCSGTPPSPSTSLTYCSSAVAVQYMPYYGSQCKSVVVPVSMAEAPVVNSSDPSAIQGALQQGVGLKWPQSYDDCSNCYQSGGACGNEDGGFTCFCKDGSSSKTSCSGKSSSSKVVIGIVAAVGVAALVGILGCAYFVVQRRKKNAERSRSNKDLFMAPSSGGTATSTTTSSQTVSSYPSSISESVPKSFYYGVQVFNYPELEEATKNFDPSRELGEGGFGTVYKGILQDGRVVAVKRHYESNFKRAEQFMNEVQILAPLRHKNLVTLFGCTSRHSRELLLVYEFIPNGTLADHLHGKMSKSTLLSWPVRFSIALETAEALAYLHEKDVIHRDVKSNNILLTEKFQVKVADFGLSRLFPSFVTHVSTAPQGTPGYVDPEYYQNYQLTDKSDVYSFGVVLVELLSSLEAVDISRHRNEVNLANLAVNRIQNQAVHELVDPYLGFEKDNGIRRMATSVAELAFRCLQQQRDMRPSMNEVLGVLRAIKSEECGSREAEAIVDINTEEIILLKKVPSPISPDSVADKWQWGMQRRTA